jgi:tetratricopeptide (TPR) repeat protein
MQEKIKVELGAVQRRLPLAVAGVAFIVYLVTLNHAATFSGLVNLANVVGWNWHANTMTPLHQLLTYPVRFLPAAVQLTALNVIAAACAAIALGLLARCVALLPHDRTRDQRQLERSEHSLLSVRWAWVPPVLAAAICGLQLSFWENAVVGTGEALDLLIFAWLVHALLMFRLDERESRLNWFAFIYGIGVANNYALIAFFPLFLGALIWIRGRTFFNTQFIMRMVLLGLAGLLLYFLLPMLAVSKAESGDSFWELVKGYWVIQRDKLVRFPRIIVILISLTSILPVVFMGIRWPAQFGEVSPLGNALTNVMTHLIHLVFLIACTYVAFDQFFSPRNLAANTAAFLPFYFLGALTIGYCTGYFLLLCGADAPNLPQWQRRKALRRLVDRAVMVIIVAAAFLIPAALAWYNLPQILANTGSALAQTATLAAKSLPSEGAVVLSDEPFRLYALENELRRSGAQNKYILVDSRSLELGGYHLHLQKKYPNRWPKLPEKLGPKDVVPPAALVQLMRNISTNQPLFYLHPSFGYYFEFFEMRPKGMVYQLRPLPATSISPPPLSEQEMADNEVFWQQLRRDELERLIRQIPPAEFQTPGSKIRVRTETLEMYVGEFYSRALDLLGVMVQRAGNISKAAEYYDLSIKLNPMNAAALLNSIFNKQLKAGRTDPVKLSDEVAKRITAAGRSWDAVLSTFGPVEEPGVCYELARAFDSGNNPRQAAQILERMLHYAPDHTNALVILIGLAVRAGLPDIALEKIAALRNGPMAAKLTADQRAQVAVSEAWAYVSKDDVSRAAEVLRSEQTRNPGEPSTWSALFDIYVSRGDPTNAMAVLEGQLKVQPQNVRSWVDLGVLKANNGKPQEAISHLDRALQINPKDEYARFNRAEVHYLLGNLDAAEKDYENLHASNLAGNMSVLVTLRLADIYFQKKKSKEAVRLYREVLPSLRKDSPEWKRARERIDQLD